MGALATAIGCLTIVGVAGGATYYFLPHEIKDQLHNMVDDFFNPAPTDQERLAEVVDGRSRQE